MEIPYTTEFRPDTGLTNPKLGIWLFLASEVMLFGSLFASHGLLRTGATNWPDQSSIVSVPLAMLNTVVLIASSVTMVLSWAALKTDVYSNKFSHGLYPATSNLARRSRESAHLVGQPLEKANQ